MPVFTVFKMGSLRCGQDVTLPAHVKTFRFKENRSVRRRRPDPVRVANRIHDGIVRRSHF